MIVDGTPRRSRVPQQHTIIGGVFCVEGVMIRSYKYRLYPNETQSKRLDFMLWQGRKVYNGALEMWQDHREINGFDPSPYDVRDYWCAQRHIEPDTIGTLPAKTVDDLIRRLDKAYKAAWGRFENQDFTLRRDGSKNYGFPRFKNRHTFTGLGFSPTKKPIQKLSDGWGKLYLTQLGNVRLRYHRLLPEETVVKWIMVSRDKLGRWWACLQSEVPENETQLVARPGVGVDIGMVFLLALSDGQTLENPRWYRESKAKRRVLQRKLDRQRRANNPQNYNADGTPKPNVIIWRKSGRMRETERQLLKLNDHITQQRHHFWHTVTDWLTNTYGLIAIEDLTLDFMIKNKRLAMSVYDAGFSTFWKMLDYKAIERGVEIVRVPPAYTSQTCSECGIISVDNRKTQANFVCIACGHSENADINAARNILNAALKGAVPALRGEIEAIGPEMPCEAHSSETLAAR